EFKVLQRNSDGTSLVEAKPITGRTNQIRVHLWHLGFPIAGDLMYLANQKLGKTQTQSMHDEPLCLRSVKVSFIHPVTKQKMTFENPLRLQ
ncbi:MAG: pseudouridine synthase, partial [Deltaproteobacteria bacterium]